METEWHEVKVNEAGSERERELSPKSEDSLILFRRLFFQLKTAPVFAVS